MPNEDCHAICSSVQAQYNHAIDALKAKELRVDSVDKRAAERVAMQEREKRTAAGFTDARNVLELAGKIEQLEERLESTCSNAATLRQQVQPLRQVATLVNAWAEQKREAADAKAEGRNLFTGNIGGRPAAYG